MWSAVLAAVGAGLLGAPHCAGMCGPLCAATGRSVWAWQAGRLIAYAAVGGVVGWMGALPGVGVGPAIGMSALLVYFSLVLAGAAPPLPLPFAGTMRIARWARTRPGALGAAVFGLFTTLLPCGLLWAALAGAAAQGSAGAAATTMAAFAVGSAPGSLLASFGVREIAAQGVWAKRAVAVAVLVTGLYAIWSRALSA